MKSLPPVSPTMGGVLAIVSDVSGDVAPEGLEGRCAAGEVEPGEFGTFGHGITDVRTGARKETDDARRHPGFVKEVHDHVGGEGGRGGGIPEHGVAAARGGGRQIAGDGSEVERGNGEDEAAERAQFDPVPDARRGVRLVLHQLLQVMSIEGEEVDELGGGGDLGLMRRLGLSEHGGGVEASTVRTSEQGGRAEEDGEALFPGKRHPIVTSGHGGFNGTIDFSRTGGVQLGKDVSVIVGHDDVAHSTDRDALAVDPGDDLSPLGGLARELRFQRGALR